MEISEDQASGWMQVKKKHRSNSKFSLHGWVGGHPEKQRSAKPNSRLSLGPKLENNVNEIKPSTASEEISERNFGISSSLASASSEGKAFEHCHDKRVVSQNDSYNLETKNTRKHKDQFEVDQQGSKKDNGLPKIKWGDLDEGTLIHYGKSSGGEFKFWGIENQNLVSEKGGSGDDGHSRNIPLDNEETKCLEGAISGDNIHLKSCSLSPRTNSVEGTPENMKDESEEDVKEQITSEIRPLRQENGDVDPSCGNIAQTGLSEAAIEPSSENSALPPSDGLLDPQLPKNSEPGGELAVADSVKESDDSKSKETSNVLLDGSLNTNAIDLDSCESKERFRERLWCFLFENLNRAVDELYLLCELECDLEQMKEASLVLDEAASDFRELILRVEKFEKLKRSLSHGSEGTPFKMQSDHRRPHALSWEVRRMTTSPRRADILSSSLEAFRQIQQERTAERARFSGNLGNDCRSCHFESQDILDLDKYDLGDDLLGDSEVLASNGEKEIEPPCISQLSIKENKPFELGKSSSVVSRSAQREASTTFVSGKSTREPSTDAEKLLHKKNRIFAEQTAEKNSKSAESLRRSVLFPEREREKRYVNSGKSLDAWKEKRNWEDILASPHRASSRFSYSPGINRKSAERVRVLHDKLMSTDKKKKSAIDLKKEAEEKHARAMRIRSQLENERVQKLQRTSEKLNRVNEWQSVRSTKLRESMFARHQRSETRHEAYLAEVVRRAGDESSKVNEVRFITSLNEENKKHILRKKLQDSELRRAEKLQVIKIKQKEDMAREEAVLERRKHIEAEKLQRLAETQRRKEEAQVRREEERKASSAAREAKAMEQMRRKEIRAKAQQEEAELMAQKLAERLSESEQRRKFYLEQIRERASMDFRDQSSPLLRRFTGKDGQAQSKSSTLGAADDNLSSENGFKAGSDSLTSEASQQSLKRRIKKIRQRLMSLKHEFPEPSAGLENSSLGYRTAVGTARAKISRWLQDLQKLRQARKDGTANFGLITVEMIKFLEGRDAELLASRQAGLLDFIASALPASHISKPEACQVTIYLLRLLKVVLAVPTNRCYFLVQNLLPPIIPMLAAALENYIKMAASSNTPSPSNVVSSKTPSGNLDSISEIVDGFLWTVAAIIGQGSCNEYQLQMQDGLIELVIAYQIIHRLRDLFALYDRPHVEGSPFPSSILLGINLLTVLSSKFKGSSSIDWDSFPSDVERGSMLRETKPSGSEDLKITSCESKVDGCICTDSPYTSHGTPMDETSVIKETRSSIFTCESSHELEDAACKTNTIDATNEPLGTQPEDTYQCSASHKVKNNSINNGVEQNNGSGAQLKRPATFLLSAMSETGLVCLPSMLTAVLLQANNRLSAEQNSYILPSNFEEVATGVLKVLNNLALIDITFIQKMLSRPDLKMEFFHIMSFILSHCTTNWGVPTDKVGLLLLESLSLLGYFALFHPKNQAVLRWGKSPTILHKVCDLPFVFFSDPELMPVLAGTLVAASYGCEQNKAVIQQELSIDMFLPCLKSCKTVHATSNHNSDDSSEPKQTCPDRKAQTDAYQKSNRSLAKASRGLTQRGGMQANSGRSAKTKSHRDGKVAKLVEDPSLSNAQSGSEKLTANLMLHCRFPASFIDKAEEFFTAEVGTGKDDELVI